MAAIGGACMHCPRPVLMLGTHVSAAPQPGQGALHRRGRLRRHRQHAGGAGRIKTADSDFTLALGDLSYGATGAEQAWCDFVTVGSAPASRSSWSAGNHESNGQNGNINDFSACLPNQLPGSIGTYGRQYYVDVPAGRTRWSGSS